MKSYRIELYIIYQLFTLYCFCLSESRTAILFRFFRGHFAFFCVPLQHDFKSKTQIVGIL